MMLYALYHLALHTRNIGWPNSTHYWSSTYTKTYILGRTKTNNTIQAHSQGGWGGGGGGGGGGGAGFQLYPFWDKKLVVFCFF